MKSYLTALLAFVCLCCHGANAPLDGFYLSAKTPTSFRVQTQAGEVLFLGKKIDLAARAESFKAIGNENSDFQLMLAIPQDAEILPISYVLLVSGIAYQTNGWGCCKDNVVDMGLHISGEQNAKEVSRYFNVQINYSQHPGYRFRTSFLPSKPSFNRGESVTVMLNLTNVGDTTVSLLNDGRDMRTAGYTYFFTAYRNNKAIPELAERTICFDCMVGSLVVQPGKTVKNAVNLSDWFDFSEPGVYEVHGFFRLRIPDSEDASMKQTVWTDYVGSDFQVVVNPEASIQGNPTGK